MYALSLIVNVGLLRRLTFSMDIFFRHFLMHENKLIRASFLPMSIVALIVLLVVASLVSSSIAPSTVLLLYVLEVHIPAILSELVVAMQASISTHHYSVSFLKISLISIGARYCELLKFKRLEEDVDFANASYTLWCLQVDKLTDVTGLSAHLAPEGSSGSARASIPFVVAGSRASAEFDFDYRGSGKHAVPMQTNPLHLYRAAGDVSRDSEGRSSGVELTSRFSNVDGNRLSMVNPLHMSPEDRAREMRTDRSSLRASLDDSRPSINPLQKFGATTRPGVNPLSLRGGHDQSRLSGRPSSADASVEMEGLYSATSSQPPPAAVSAAAAGGEWIEKFSKERGRKYWKNTVTGQSTWNAPDRVIAPPKAPAPPPAPPVAPAPPPAPPAAPHVLKAAIVESDDGESDDGESGAATVDADAAAVRRTSVSELKVHFETIAADSGRPMDMPKPSAVQVGRRGSVSQLASMFAEGGAGSSSSSAPVQRSALAEAEAVLRAPGRRTSVVKLTDGFKDIVRTDAVMQGQLNPLIFTRGITRKEDNDDSNESRGL